MGACLLYSGVNAIYVMPTAKQSEKFASTRLNTVLDGSPDLKGSLYPGTDSASVKRFINDSFIFMQGASKGTQAISIPCDFLVIDEEDFAEDTSVLTTFTSRLLHSSYGVEDHFSTPTHTGRGVSFGFENSKRFLPLHKCPSCNKYFQADYYRDIFLPNFTEKGRDLAEFNYFTRTLLATFDLKTAYLRCPNPKCHRPFDYSKHQPTFVCENPDSNYYSHGYQITPFCVPSRTPDVLIQRSTQYRRRAIFINDCLGLPFSDEESGLSEMELNSLFLNNINSSDASNQAASNTYCISGTDMGGTCAHLVARPVGNDSLYITEAKRIPLSEFKQTFQTSLTSNRVVCSVIDALPYTDLVLSLQAPSFYASRNVWGALQTNRKMIEPFAIREVEEDKEKALHGMKAVSIKRDILMDIVMGMIRNRQILFGKGCLAEQDVIVKHLTDMKRTKITDKDGEEVYTWTKSETGEDHYMFALIFLIVANFIKGTAGGNTLLPFLAASMRLKSSL